MMKYNLDTLNGLFNNNQGPQISSCEPEASNCGEMASSTDDLVLKIKVPECLNYFEGHFPEHPVLPGVVQINWAGQLAKFLFSELGPFKSLTNVKFKTMVLPGENLFLKLVYKRDKNQIVFRYFNPSTEFSSGAFAFTTP